MVQTTPNFGIPYPEPTDNVNLWEHLQNLAEAVEDALSLPGTCRLVATAAQTLTHNVRTALTFPAEEIDTRNWHSTSVNTSRITPDRPGKYGVSGSLYMGGRADYSLIVADLAKNGTALASAEREQPNTQNSARSLAPPFTIVTMNGTTDYVELYGQHTNGASANQATNQSSQFSSTLQLIYLCP